MIALVTARAFVQDLCQEVSRPVVRLSIAEEDIWQGWGVRHGLGAVLVMPKSW